MAYVTLWTKLVVGVLMFSQNLWLRQGFMFCVHNCLKFSNRLVLHNLLALVDWKCCGSGVLLFLAMSEDFTIEINAGRVIWVINLLLSCQLSAEILKLSFGCRMINVMFISIKVAESSSVWLGVGLYFSWTVEDLTCLLDKFLLSFLDCCLGIQGSPVAWFCSVVI